MIVVNIVLARLQSENMFSGSRAAGKLLSVYGNIGLAVLRFPYLDQELSIKGTDVKLVGSKPSWWPEELR